MQKQPLNNLFHRETANHNKTQIYKSPGEPSYMAVSGDKLLLTFVRFMAMGSAAVPDSLHAVFLRLKN